MVALVRRHAPQWFTLPIHIILFAFLLQVPLVLALPHRTTFALQPHLHSPAHPHPQTLTSRAFIITNASSSGPPQILNPSTHQPIPQGTATDGGGTGFDAPAIIWVAFSFIVGLPMALAGIRCWRVTTGVGVGLGLGVCSWAALTNNLNSIGVPDAFLTCIVIGFFLLGFTFGLFEIGRVAGLILLGITGGLAIGVRADILRPGLLVSSLYMFWVNWIVVAVMGALGGVAMVVERTKRCGVLFGSASAGTFFVALGMDLLVNRQEGMSRGLRFLFDRNASHALDIVVGGYTPPLSTQIIIAISLGLTPLLGFIQHRVFKAPFSRKSEVGPLPDFLQLEEGEDGKKAKGQTSLFNNLTKPLNLSRFSL